MERRDLETDVLVVGAGAAGMYAALTAAEAGAGVLLLDKSLIGRGGATVMAQMTVAAAIGHAEPDDPQSHFEDTLTAGRGLADPALARILCEEAPARIMEMDEWRVGWARDAGGRISQVMAPGHAVPRCVYVDFLNTGPAVSKALRARLNRCETVRRLGEVAISDILVEEGRVVGAAGLHVPTGDAVVVRAPSVIIATGGLTRLYQRNSASISMTGDGYALALKAGAELVDMEFPQFFPIGHLAPRLVGMDPIMWDPFRYKLGGRLLNGEMQPFVDRYGVAEADRYVATRDQATYAILKEVEAGRGSPAGGAWLSFAHVPESELRGAFGPVIEKLAANGIDLTKDAIEVSPIAHYHMGGIVVGEDMATRVPGLFAAGEAVGGANGANRLSGNAVPEAFVFGARAGRAAATHAVRAGAAAINGSARQPLDALASVFAGDRANARPATPVIEHLQALMTRDVGPFRTGAALARALDGVRDMRRDLGGIAAGGPRAFNMGAVDRLDLEAMLTVAEAIIVPALARTESRGAHQRDDHPGLDEVWQASQVVAMDGDRVAIVRKEARP